MPEDLSGKRLLVVEEALKDFVGHWYEYVRAVVDLNRTAGVTVEVVANARAQESLTEELGAHAVFERSPWDGDYQRDGRRLALPTVLRHNALVLRRMWRFLGDRPRYDCLFAPTVVGNHIWGWRLLWTLRRRKIGRLVLLIRNNVGAYDTGSEEPRFGLAARLFGWGLRSFSAHVAAGAVIFATDSARLAEEYRKLNGMELRVFPSPRVAPFSVPSTPDPDAPLVFACLGPARFEKGIDVLQQAIALYLADPANPPARFAIQWPQTIADATGAPYPPDPALAASGRVEFLTEPLDSTQYDALLARTGCMVLPYRRSSYFARISGVAVEAVTAGIPVIATADTWTSELVASSGAGIAVADGDAPAFAAAMARVARERTAFAAAAQDRRSAAQAAHTGDAFLRALWGES